MLRSIARRITRRFSKADRYHVRGIPKPVGRTEQPASIWIAWTLDFNVLGYLVTAGRLANPVAFVFGSEDEPVKRVSHADYRKALDIAHDFELAGNETPFIFDLRNFEWDKPGGRLGFILDLVLFPTDRHGGGVYKSSAGPIHGAMLDYQGLRITLHEEGIPWGQKTSPHRWMHVPVFEIALGNDGWAEVPAGLKNHLDRIHPKPNKNGGHLPLTRTPGQHESKAAATAA